MDGILRCSRYAFGPNRLHYCGPEANRDILGYIKEGISDIGLASILGGFKTMYPYLQFIARANKISDPFEEKVVEAYWIGNDLLKCVKKRDFYNHLIDDHGLKKKISKRLFNKVASKIDLGAFPHHSFHVLNVWKRTGNFDVYHTLLSMDSCRIGWGSVLEVSGPYVTMESEPLVVAEGKLALGEKAKIKATRFFDATGDLDFLKPGDTVSTHWGAICEIITPEQSKNLRKYTLQGIKLANHDFFGFWQ